MPVAIGSVTDWRSITPGANRSTGSVCGVDRSLVVDRLPQRVHDAADQRLADGNAHDLAGALDLLAFAQLGVVAQQHGADLVFVQVHREAGDTMRELDQFAGHHLVQPVDARNPVAKRHDCTNFVYLHPLLVIRDFLAKERRYLICPDLCHISL